MGKGYGNGSIIGAPNVPSMTAAPGIWGVSEAAYFIGGYNSSEILYWPGSADASYSSVSGLWRFQETATTGALFDSTANGLILQALGTGNSSNSFGLSSAQKKWFKYSLLIRNGATVGYEYTGSQTPITFGTGDFTVEGWFYRLSSG